MIKHALTSLEARSEYGSMFSQSFALALGE